jgi:hypothetical protein
MRTLMVASLTVLMLVCGTNASASARGWRDLRIDASSDSRFNESVQQMRNELPYHRAVFFVLVLKDLKKRFAPTEYRQQLDGLTYKQIAHLASPTVSDEYLTYYARLHSRGAADPSGAPMFQGFSGVANPFGAFPGFDQTTGRQLPAP